MLNDLPERLRDLADAVAACEWELPIDAVLTCHSAAIAISVAKLNTARLTKELADARLATRCFVRLFQFEGGIVSDDDIEFWPWIEQWVIT